MQEEKSKCLSCLKKAFVVFHREFWNHTTAKNAFSPLRRLGWGSRNGSISHCDMWYSSHSQSREHSTFLSTLTETNTCCGTYSSPEKKGKGTAVIKGGLAECTWSRSKISAEQRRSSFLNLRIIFHCAPKCIKVLITD